MDARTGRPTTLACNRRELEEELQPPPLTPVPARLATALERQLGEALGITGNEAMPRLPMEVEGCRQGGRCCWRWLARAALEHIAGGPMGHWSLPEMVTSLKEELEYLRTKRDEAQAANERAAAAEEALESLRIQVASTDKEVGELRAMQREFGRLQAEVQCLQVSNGRQSALQQGLQQEVASLKLGARQSEQKIADAERRAADAQADLAKVRLFEQDLRRQLEATQKELAKKDSEFIARANLSRSPSYGRRGRSRRGGAIGKPRK